MFCGVNAHRAHSALPTVYLAAANAATIPISTLPLGALLLPRGAPHMWLVEYSAQ